MGGGGGGEGGGSGDIENAPMKESAAIVAATPAVMLVHAATRNETRGAVLLPVAAAVAFALARAGASFCPASSSSSSSSLPNALRVFSSLVGCISVLACWRVGGLERARRCSVQSAGTSRPTSVPMPSSSPIAAGTVANELKVVGDGGVIGEGNGNGLAALGDDGGGEGARGGDGGGADAGWQPMCASAGSHSHLRLHVLPSCRLLRAGAYRGIRGMPARNSTCAGGQARSQVSLAFSSSAPRQSISSSAIDG